MLIDEKLRQVSAGTGLAGSLNELIINCDMPLILTVRNSFLELVTENWMFRNPLVIEAENAEIDSIMVEIEKFVSYKSV